VKIAGVSHIFGTLPGVKESILDIVMNLKRARFVVAKEGKYIVSIVAKGVGKITAADIEGDVEAVNKDLYICELTSDKGKIDIEAIVELGYGFSPTEERTDVESGYIAIDASFSPVKLVNFKVEDARVGRKSNFEKLTLDITTDGSVSPAEVLSKVSTILVEHFAYILSGKDTPPVDVPVEEKKSEVSDAKSKVLETIIDELNLPSRVINALLRENIETVSDLLARGKSELVGLKGVGRKSIDLINEELKKMGVELS
jgi:DNA-directed RNA polymerase subunit alpha